MKKIIYLLTIFSLVSSLFLSSTANTLAKEEHEDEMLHFIITVKWGNVLGEIENKDIANFDGTISVSEKGKISLIRSLLFETHTSKADLITSNMDPVSWNSLIYGHWDGIRARVSSPANENIIISTSQGSIAKTARELFDVDEKIIQDVGDGKEITVKTHPVKNRSFAIKLIWGSDRSSNPIAIEDFSGALSVTDGATIELIRTIRFEKGDSITNLSELSTASANQISWKSNIWNDIDGILIKFIANKDINLDTAVTLSFPEQGYKESASLMKLFHKRKNKDEIKPGYFTSAERWDFTSRALIRAKGDHKVYMIEDDLKRHIPNPAVFEDQNLDWDDVQEVEPDEVEVLPESDPLSYTEGTLVRGSGPKVYAISNGQKRHITDPIAFTKLQYDWNNIVKVDDSELNLYPTSAIVNKDSDYPDSTLVRVQDQPTVYVVEGDKLKPITSPDAFDSHNYRWNRVKIISPSVKIKYKVSDDLELGDGSLVRSRAGKIYAIDKGKKRQIRTDDDLNKAGFKKSRIIDVSDEEIGDIDTGHDLDSNDLD